MSSNLTVHHMATHANQAHLERAAIRASFVAEAMRHSPRQPRPSIVASCARDLFGRLTRSTGTIRAAIRTLPV